MKRTVATLATATMLISSAACISSDDPHKRAKQGAAIGAASGAVLGAVIGHQNDEKGEGAVIGAAVGAGIGAAIGHKMDRQQRELEQIEGVEVSRPTEDRIDLTIRNEVLFLVDSTTLQPRAQNTLAELAQVFSQYPETEIVVEGHADSSGPEDYNQRLSERRAESVTRYLTAYGVGASRIDAVGFGETLPRASNETPEGRQLNRRVEIRVKAQS